MIKAWSCPRIDDCSPVYNIRLVDYVYEIYTA